MPHDAQKTPVWMVARIPGAPAFRTFPVPAGRGAVAALGALDGRAPKVGCAACPNDGWDGVGRLPIGARDGARTVGESAGIGAFSGTESVDTSSILTGLAEDFGVGGGDTGAAIGSGVGTEKAEARASSSGPDSTGRAEDVEV